MNHHSLIGNIVDVVNRCIYPGTLYIENGIITRIISEPETAADGLPFLLPGFVDAHVHIESSMLVPSEFARLAVVHGTVGTVSDPHEIANVLGVEGVEYMIENSKKVPVKFYFGAPSCVPATPFESSGAIITPEDVKKLLSRDAVKYLSEMMNYPGVILQDDGVMKKIQYAHDAGKVIDGHIPGVKGQDLKKYAEAGITTDHECFTIEEAQEKISLGMKVLIREGSAAKNFDELIPLLATHPDMIMFCSDDKHPNDLIEGHINLLVKKALMMGFDLFDTLRCVTLNPKMHYGLDTGLLQPGDVADFLMADNLADLTISATYIQGEKVAEKGKALFDTVQEKAPNKFFGSPIHTEQLLVPTGGKQIRVIQALDGQLITKSVCMDVFSDNGYVESDTDRDLLKLVSMNRYQESSPQVAFINGFGLKSGAIASTVAHDSHNIIATGANDADIVQAINLLIKHKGGIAVARGEDSMVLPLPVAGIMTNADGYETARLYDEIDARAKELGSTLKSPFMTLSFMALLVIPELKLSDKGLFDGNTFQFTSLFCE
jgi:adenine deaminase